MKNKRGSHIGMILSFVIFIGFLIFLYVVIEPAVESGKNKQNQVENLKIELEERFSSKLVTSIVANESDPSLYSCLIVNNSAINVSNMNAIVKNEEEQIINSKMSGDELTIDWGGNEKFFKIFYSKEELEEGEIFSCGFDTETNYYQGLVFSKEYVFSSKVVEVLNEYYSDYEHLKEELNVPRNSEFDFNFRLDNGTEIKTPEKNIGGDVFLEEYPMEYLDKEANLRFGSLTIRVW